jgi:hypothetical protein
MADVLVPIAISSEIDQAGDERIHVAKYSVVPRTAFTMPVWTLANETWPAYETNDTWLAGGRVFQLGDDSLARVRWSTDWVNWDLTAGVGSAALLGIAEASGNYVLCTYGGGIISSPDRVNWTVRIASSGISTNSYNAIAAGLTYFATVGEGGKIQVFTTALDSFPTTTSPTAVKLYSVAYGNGKFRACGNTGVIVGADEATPTTWTVKRTGVADLGFTHTLVHIVHDGTQFVALGHDNSSINKRPVVVTSIDGDTWVSQIIGDAKVARMEGIGYGNGKWLACGKAYTLPDGTTGLTNDNNGLAYDSDDLVTWNLIYTNLPGPLGIPVYHLGKFGFKAGDDPVLAYKSYGQI